MKKILFCASVLALATSCVENELDSFATNDGQATQGITFTAEAPATRMQWDETETSFVPFWYAEQDRIKIYGIGVFSNSGSGIPGGAFNEGESKWTGGDSWNDISSESGKEYKATQSEAIGKFTSVDNANTLYFGDNKEARFLGLYPSTMTAEWSATDGGLKISTLPVLTAQTQTTTKGDNQSIAMYSLSKASKENDYDAVGENANLSFQRPFSALVLSTKNINEYTTKDEAGNSLFGPLKTITVTAKGYTKEGETKAEIEASKLTYDNTKAYLVVDTLNYSAKFVAGTTPDEKSEVVLTLKDASGLDWSDDALAVISIKDVDRSKTFTEDKKETMTTKWEFGNITLQVDNATANSWNGFVDFPALDIEDFDYLVTKDNQLIVLNGNFSDVFDQSGNNIVWEAGNVAKTSIKTIISKVALTDEELAMLKDFTALTSLTLEENTEIPANTFTTTQAAAITKLDLPKVTKVDEKFIANSNNNAFSALATLLMPAYEFEDNTVNQAFFNTDVQGQLTTLDMSGVRSMLPQFGIERTLSFKGYASLTTVTVQDGMVVSPSGFAGCKALKTVNGAVDIESAPSAFEMEVSNGNNALKSIEVKGTVIPNNAFFRCSVLETITCGDAALTPTSIGENGFRATSIKYMDLSKATTIGANAFANSSITSADKNSAVLEVGVNTISAGTFINCPNLKMVKFTNATTIAGGDVFKDDDNLIQVKFLKVISLANAADDAYNNVFGSTPSNIDLWTNPEQTGVNGLNFTLNYMSEDGKTPYTASWIFHSIQKKIED